MAAQAQATQAIRKSSVDNRSILMSESIINKRPNLKLIDSNGQFGKFGSFGPIAASSVINSNQVVKSGWIGALSKLAVGDVGEIRDRLKEFVRGSLSFGRGSDFKKYLETNNVGLEKHTRADGGVIHIRDHISGQTVPAAQIDSRKFSEKNITRTLQRNAKSEKAQQTEAEIAALYRSKMSYMIKDAVENNGLPANDWVSMEWNTHAALGTTHAYAVKDNVGYIGISVGQCLDTPAETELFLKNKFEEIQTRTGRKVSFVYDQALTPGTPILIADRNLVRAASVHNCFDLKNLEASFLRAATQNKTKAERSLLDAKNDNQKSNLERKIKESKIGMRTAGYLARYREEIRNAPALSSRGVADNVKIVKIENFRQRFAKKENDIAPVSQAHPSIGFEFDNPVASVSEFHKKQVSIKEIGGTQRIWHSKEDRELGQFPSMHHLPVGEYPKEDEYGMPTGKIKVDENGNVLHMNMLGREHNLDGPSFQPAPTNRVPRRWAIDGQTIKTPQEFRARVNQMDNNLTKSDLKQMSSEEIAANIKVRLKEQTVQIQENEQEHSFGHAPR